MSDDDSQDSQELGPEPVPPAPGGAAPLDAAAMAQAFLALLTSAAAGGGAGAPGAAAVTTRITPFDGGALDLSSRSGSSAFFEASKPLPQVFNFKPDEVFLLRYDLTIRASLHGWNDITHGITTINHDGSAYNLLEEHGQIDRAWVEAERIARNTPPADVRAQQNARIMFICLYSSLGDSAKTTLIGEDFHEDGPTLFIAIMKMTFTATFEHAQATRNKLMVMSPRKFSFNIVTMNKYIRTSILAISDASYGQAVSQREMLSYAFNAYKRIKQPEVWTQYINFIENTAVAILATPSSSS
jgi:hypothetical protein